MQSTRYGMVQGTVNGRGGRVALWLALGISLALLGFFKYFNFFADSAVRTLNALGFDASPFTLQILLPVGISFFTFQAIAYTIDVYWGRETAQKNFWLFALYVSYFPQLVAGPIERSTHLIPELRKWRVVTSPMFYSACQLILIGYFKKVFIADGVAPMVTRCFTEADLSGLALLCGMYLFALQIYGDFAGYTDIARGVSRLFGIELCLNFRQPYFSANITEFWRRWHISLSSWLRDYLYIPLGGSHNGPTRTYLNNMITMLLGGLWHGANWTFVVWGGLHGFYLAVHKFLLGDKKTVSWSPFEGRREQNRIAYFLRSLRWLVCVLCTFHLVCFAWIFFRADTISQAFDYINRIIHFYQTGRGGFMVMLAYVLFYYFWAGLVDLLCVCQKSEVPFTTKWPSPVRGFAYALMIILMIFIGASDVQPFIYFQF
ncbi:MAG: MBOAT family O-acyltransferase [Planctomycetia bacterium]|nr:MBOAT family O-acyltransferase [Planctomycetia bacterium]